MKAYYRILLSSALAVISLTGVRALAQPALPDKFGPWTKSGCVDKPAATLLAGEAGDRMGAASCTYSAGNARVVVWSEAFRDPSAAYEIYTLMLRPGMNASTLDGLSAVEGD